MWSELIFPDEVSASLKNLGIFHLNVEDAAVLVTKCLWESEGLFIEDLDYQDKSFDNVEVVVQFRRSLAAYKKLIVTGIVEGNLETALSKKFLDEAIDTENTFLDVNVLTEFLSERSLDIQGDTLAEYAKNQSKLLELAVTTIRYGLPDENSKDEHRRKEHVLFLEEEIRHLRERVFLLEHPEIPAPKDLHTKERETLLKLVIGMAVDGYGYDPGLNRSPIPRELADILDAKGISLDPDTVRKWLKEAAEILPPDAENPVG